MSPRRKLEKILVLVAVLLTATIIAVIPTIQNQTTNQLVHQSLLLSVNTPGNLPTVKGVIWENKTVTGSETYSNMEIILNGNLTVESSGSLTLKNVTLNVNCTANGTNWIVVKSGAALYISDGDDNPSTRNDASNIKSYNQYRFNFHVEEGATFHMRNSELHHCGYAVWNPPYYIHYVGLRVAANRAVIENNLFTNNEIGIIIVGSSNCIIRNNNATNNDYIGFYSTLSSINSFIGNTATHNCFGFMLEYCDYNNITGNTATDNCVGFMLEYCVYNNITGNTATDNCVGFMLEYCDYNNIIGNTATDNDETGLFQFGSDNNNLANNIAERNTYGFYLKESNSNNLTGNLATHNYYAFYLSVDSWDNYLSNNTAKYNSYDYFFEGYEEMRQAFWLLLYLALQYLSTQDQMLLFAMVIMIVVFIICIFCPLIGIMADRETSTFKLLTFTILLIIFGGVFCYTLTRGYLYVDPEGFKIYLSCIAYLLITQPNVLLVSLFLNFLFSIRQDAIFVFIYLADKLFFEDYVSVLVGTTTPYLFNYAGIVQNARLFFLWFLGFLTLGFLKYLVRFLSAKPIHYEPEIKVHKETSRESSPAPKKPRKYKLNEYGEIVEEEDEDD
jgi:parallel beta-helix repeat protein